MREGLNLLVRSFAGFFVEEFMVTADFNAQLEQAKPAMKTHVGEELHKLKAKDQLWVC